MKGLLLKDIYTLGKQMKIFLALIVLFTIIPGSPMYGFAIIYIALLPITALAYDERSKWDTLAAMMPYSSTSIVFSKYLLGYLSVFCAALLSLAGQVAVSLLRQLPIDSDTLLSIPLFVGIALFMLAICFPLLFRMGVERGRLLFLALIAAIATASVTLINILTLQISGFFDARFPSLLLVLLCIAFIVGINIGSIFLSIRCYHLHRK